MSDITQPVQVASINNALECEGYWSRRLVLANATNDILFDRSISPSVIASHLHDRGAWALEDYLKSFARNAITHMGKPTFNRSLSFAMKGYGIRSFPLANWANDTVEKRRGSWKGKYTNYEEAFSVLVRRVGVDEAVNQLASIYLKEGNTTGYQAMLTSEFSARMDSPSAMIRIDWKHALRPENIEDFLAGIARLSLPMPTRSVKGIRERVVDQWCDWCSTVPVTDENFLVRGDLSVSRNYNNILGMRKAVEWGMLTMIQQGWLLMPLSWPSLIHSPILYEAPWWPELGRHFPVESTWCRQVFTRLLCTSTAQSPHDLSVVLCKLYNPASAGMAGSMVKGFSQAIQRFQIDNPDLPKFPLGEINNRRKLQRKQEEDRTGSPERLMAEGYEDWALAIETYYKLSPLRRMGLRAAVKPLLDWALAQGHKSPWDIETRHLLDPLNPENRTTFHVALLAYASTARRTGWQSASRFFKIVYNALKPLPQYDHLNLKNPFQGLDRPFRAEQPRTPLGKTYRRLMPAELLHAMLDTLLDCDDDGVPQYTWVKQRFPVDCAERFDHQTQTYEMVWHPARARCLAILLLIPLRSKQARWLDQGLMDHFRWEVTSNEWIENTHPLTKYRYGNGLTHTQHYGRSSGVLQPLDSLLGGNASHIGLYISTNKTQLWNAEQRTGYAIPWPDGSELLASNDPNLHAQGRRLGLVYQLIREQIAWQEKYDPNPSPTHFADEGEAFSVETIAALPVFCPIFRDLISPASRPDGEPVHVPISKAKLDLLFHALAAEAEDRLIARGHAKEAIGLTVLKRNQEIMIKLGRSELLRRCTYDIHSLRVAGITHLLEMGVPAHIVSEFIAGHMALVMTLHYAKFQPLKLRQRLLDAFNEAQSIERFETSIAKHGPAAQGLLVANDHFDKDLRPDPSDVFQVRGTWRYLNGGICPGASCDEGGIRVVSVGRDVKEEVVPVAGGPESCGNCRFFLTSPSFVVSQMLTANSLMLKLREIGRQRKRLWDDKARIELSIFDDSATSRERSDLLVVSAELERLDRQLEPLILEWYNRYEMFRKSMALIEGRDDTGVESVGAVVKLVGTPDGIGRTAHLDPHGSDYTLVKEIVAQSEMLGGHRPVTELAEYKLREFVDRLLIHESVPDLLLSMPEGSARRRAALMLADALEVLTGGTVAIERSAEGSNTPPLQPRANQLLRELAARLAHGDSRDLTALLAEVEHNDEAINTP
jgi:hypothetical protein